MPAYCTVCLATTHARTSPMIFVPHCWTVAVAGHSASRVTVVNARPHRSRAPEIDQLHAPPSITHPQKHIGSELSVLAGQTTSLLSIIWSELRTLLLLCVLLSDVLNSACCIA